MAQRVFMVPFKDEQVQDFVNSVVTGNSRKYVESISGQLIKHDTIVKNSKACESKAETILKNRRITENEIYYYTAFRPFFLTCDASQVNTKITQLLKDEKSVGFIFDEQLKILGSEFSGKIIDDNETNLIENIIEEINVLHSVYLKIIHDEALTIQRPILIEEAETGFSYYNDSETEEVNLKGDDLIEYYTRLLGTDLGYILGKTQPSWWLGNDFWLGKIILLAQSDDSESIIEFAQAIENNVISSASLFSSLNIQNMEKYLPINCEPYTTGLVIQKENVDYFYRLIDKNKQFIIALYSLLNNTKESDVEFCYNSMMEALNYANEYGFNLIEGDEIVGSYGLR